MRSLNRSRSRILLIGVLVLTSLALQSVAASGKGSRRSALSRYTIVADQFSSFFVREGAQQRITLSMLVSHSAELTAYVRKLTGDAVTPLIFAVSTLPDRHSNFDPQLLTIEQTGKSWKPNPSTPEDILPLAANSQFGGEVGDGLVHQGVVFAPAWLNPNEPMIVHYGDFAYRARLNVR